MNAVFQRILYGITLLSLVSLGRAQVTTVNVTPDSMPALNAAANSLGLTLVAGRPDAPTISGQLVIWEARSGGTDINADRAKRIADYVRNGGSLLLSLTRSPGTGPFRLGFMLPTSGWNFLEDKGTVRGDSTASEWDRQLFPDTSIVGFSVPYYFEIRPFHAVERGQARYDRYARPIGRLDDLKVPANAEWWSRPLIDRQWQIRVRGNDIGQSPLLLTGRYGAGRVAVFASSVAGADAPAARAFWTPVLRWLTTRDAATATAGVTTLPTPAITTDSKARMLHVVVQNPTAAPLPVIVVARLLTWEHALIGDVERTITLPAGGTTTTDIPLPAPSATNYQALSYRDAFDVRLGVLSADGALLLNETKQTIDLRSDMQLAVATDEVRTYNYPFNAPKPEKDNRMGLPVMAYAYAPGQTVNATVSVSNGLRNLAPLATARDESNPANASATALNDEAVLSEKGTDWYADAYGMWTGAEKKDNVISFTFPRTVTLGAVTLVGAADNYRNYHRHCPATVIVELDGKEVTRLDDADQQMLKADGLLRLPFAPTRASVVRIRMPWVNGKSQQAPWLGDVQLEGTVAETLPAPVQGTMTLTLKNVVTGTSTPVTTRTLTVSPCTRETISLPVTIPAADNTAHFYRLDASFRDASNAAPFMVLQPVRPLLPLAQLTSGKVLNQGFIVTRGFRNCFDTGTGTQEIGEGWGQPDDLVWAYSRQLKQVGARAHTRANKLYVTDDDMRHYSTPWRAFDNGEEFYDIATPSMIAMMKKDYRWKNVDTIVLGHSDRWDTGPEMGGLHSWQDFEGFNDYLISQGKPGLTGRTREELVAEIHGQHEDAWQAWNVLRYVHDIRVLRDSYAAEGKKLVITAQGLTIVPMKYAQEVGEVVKGMSDDVTWGMDRESVPLTTARQMGAMAFSPVWSMSTLNQWGYVSGLLGNNQWRGPVGTTEPSRRFLYDRAFRGMIRPDGSYTSMHTYGYNSNAGYAYTMNTNDYQEWEREQEKHSLLTPDGPIGAGVVVSTAKIESAENMAIGTPYDNGGKMSDINAVKNVIWRLQDAGISIPFSTNEATLSHWTGDAPMILINVTHFSDEQIADLQRLNARGVALAAFMGDGTLSPATAKFFGVNADGTPSTGKQVLALDGHPVVQRSTTMLIAMPAEAITASQAAQLAPYLKSTLHQAIDFPLGTSGYGFVSNGNKFILLEDWREEGRVAAVRYHAPANAKALRAVDVNEHTPLNTRRDGDAFVIDVPIRPGDATLICIEEVR